MMSPGLAVDKTEFNVPGVAFRIGAPAIGAGTVRVVTVPVRTTDPPSGSVSETCTSYVVFDCTSKMLPASLFGQVKPTFAPAGMRRRSIPMDQDTSPSRRYCTATAAFKLSSPVIGHSIEMLLIVGNGKATAPATVSLDGVTRSSSRSIRSRSVRVSRRVIAASRRAGAGACKRYANDRTLVATGIANCREGL